MYRVIMIQTDGSGFDREAIRVALRIADRCDAKVRLVRVLGNGTFFGTEAAAGGANGADELVHSERDKALGELYALAAECRNTSKADISVDLHAGHVSDVLEGYARRHDRLADSPHGDPCPRRETSNELSESARQRGIQAHSGSTRWIDARRADSAPRVESGQAGRGRDHASPCSRSPVVLAE